MSIEQQLHQRANAQCELCAADGATQVMAVPPAEQASLDTSILLCSTCEQQIQQGVYDENHWRCLNDSMWSQVPAVQVMAWRMLHRLRAFSWPQDLLDMLYLDDTTLAWAKAEGDDQDEVDLAQHKDANDAVLAAGDTVVLIKDLVVKGANFTAKRGTAVRGISLVADTPEHIEGRVNGQQIVILTQFVKKSK